MKRYSLTRPQRRIVLGAVVTIVVALLVAATAVVVADRHNPHRDAGTRADIQTAAVAALTALMTFTDQEPQPDSVPTLLTDPLATRYRTVGRDLVLPGAAALGASMSARVIGTGIDHVDPAGTRVLAFVDQTVNTRPAPAGPDAPPGPAQREDAQRTPIARWAVMRKVEDKWLMADLLPVGDVTR
ncbi:hypothetical protein GCM10009624_02720 [Gordonia sinesedis]